MFLAPHKHSIPKGHGDRPPYARIHWFANDGMGTGHYAVLLRCASCGKEFAIANFHVAKEETLTANGPTRHC